ncbi:MAG: hypothetical protein WAO20_12615 [Acidobacteriota bacterium]
MDDTENIAEAGPGQVPGNPAGGTRAQMMRGDNPVGFVVLAAPRSGSTWLIDLIHRSTGTTVYGELFIPRRRPRSERRMSAQTAAYLDSSFRGLPLFCETAGGGAAVRPFRTLAYLNRLFGGSCRVGFKLMYANLMHFPEVWAYVIWRRLPVVHLVRENHLDSYISSQMRYRTNTVHSLVGETGAEGVRIQLDGDDLLQSMRRSRRNQRIARVLLRASRVPHLEIRYESLSQNMEPLNEVCRFLRLDMRSGPIDSNLRKLVTGAHAQLISNYAEIRGALRGTGFERFLS